MPISSPGDDRGTSTRQRLLDVAVDVFGSRGFEATPTRILAKEAETQLTAISYHFVNKQGLYRAAARHVAEGIARTFESHLHGVGKALDRHEISREELINLACVLMNDFASRLIGGSIPTSWSRFISREFVEPTESFFVVFAAMEPFGRTLAQIISRVWKLPVDDPRVRICMLTLVGQVLVFRTSRAAALQFLQWKNIDDAALALVLETVRSNTRQILATRTQEE